MSSTKNKRKTATAIAATAVTAAVLLTGTYAWQNLNQEATNKAASINPGGRLHDDFNGKNKDIYVENFADQRIYARIQLTEYMETGEDAGKNFDSTEGRTIEVITTDSEGAASVYDDKSTWEIHDFAGENTTASYWSWTTGGSTIYMPTFNMDKESLDPEINGTFEGPDGQDGIDEGDQADRYDDYVTYTDGEEIIDDEIYAGGEIVEDQTHTAKSTIIADEVISMATWNNLTDDQKAELNAWVYDTDGWAYWSQPIEPYTATGLLLDGIELTGTVGDEWFYAINVVAQFITADDLGKETGTGFYDTTKGTEPTAEALELLASIGVDTTGVTGGDNEEDEPTTEISENGIVMTLSSGVASIGGSTVTTLASDDGSYISFNLTTTNETEEEVTYTLQKKNNNDNYEEVADGVTGISGATLNLAKTDESAGDYKITASNGNTLEFSYYVNRDQIIIRFDDVADNPSSYGTEGYLISSDQLQLSTLIIPADDSEVDTTAVTWELEDPQNKATLTNNDTGVILSVNGDSTITDPYYITVTATYGNGVEVANILVAENGIVTDVSYTGSESTFYVNEEYTFTASAVSGSEPVDIFDTWQWGVYDDQGEFVDESIASITKDGVFTAKVPGTYTIGVYPTVSYAFYVEETVTVIE